MRSDYQPEMEFRSTNIRLVLFYDTVVLGQIVAIPGALAALKKSEQQPGEFLTRHVNREWGDLSDEDRKENEYSLEHGFRLLSAYRTHAGETTLLNILGKFIP